MPVTPKMREKLHRAYLEFFEVAERKRRWSVFDDIPWDKIDPAKNSARKAVGIETYCAEEFYLPDYTAGGVVLTRSIFGAAWFQACWSYEESKHGLVLREYLLRSGLRSAAELSALEDKVCSRAWTLPFPTRRQMACYGALQEGATYRAYKAQKEKAALDGDHVLEAIFLYLSRDEAAHAGFYRVAVELELEEDRAGTINDLALVLSQFKMPGDGLIDDYQARLRDSGAGISPRAFLAQVVFPTLRTLGTSSAELKTALRIASTTAPAMVAESPVVDD